MMSVPSEEDFARADRLAKERFRNLDVVAEHVKQHFMPICPLHNVYIFSERDVNFRACVFFKKDSDIEACKRGGIVDQIAEFIREELERAGRGKKEDTTVAFEIDSDENVDRSFAGGYWERLR